MSFEISGVTISGGITIENKTTKAYLNVGYMGVEPIDPGQLGQQSANGVFSYNGIGASFDTSGFGPYFSDVRAGWLVNGPGVVNIPIVFGPDTMGLHTASFVYNPAVFTVGESYTFTNPN
jgi:hypothetical protein